ncbi:YdhK family protein [Priestia megaterium]|uniref:YdhK family protein n=1 Tax=Priestia megaterium TaxID=1404 RepID=UPI00300ABCA7
MKKQLFILGASVIIGLSGCGNDSSHEKPSADKNESMHDHSEMNHSSSGEVPKGLKKAENPTYKVGDKAVIKADHMKGMKGAKATIVSAEKTTVYMVDYAPTTGGEKVKNHKWVTESELSAK